MNRIKVYSFQKLLLRNIFPFIFLLLISYCHTTIVIPYKSERVGDSSQGINHKSKSYILGYFEGGHEKVECAEGIEKIQIQRGIIDFSIHFFLGGVFNTRSVDVECVQPDLDFDHTKESTSLVLKGVYFHQNSDQLRAESFAILDKLAQHLIQNKEIHILISGHTDLIGNYKSNKVLSENRALSTKSYLVSKDINESRIRTVGFGSQRPIFDSTNEKSSKLNRRIEVQFFNYSGFSENGKKEFLNNDSNKPLSQIFFKNGRIDYGYINKQNENEIFLEKDGRIFIHSKKNINKIVFKRKK
jgi:outer membrane protein OmpA-like peptidoglycan-associated protein